MTPSASRKLITGLYRSELGPGRIPRRNPMEEIGEGVLSGRITLFGFAYKGGGSRDAGAAWRQYGDWLRTDRTTVLASRNLQRKRRSGRKVGKGLQNSVQLTADTRKRTRSSWREDQDLDIEYGTECCNNGGVIRHRQCS
jgi:hypothetical protein